MSNSIESFLVFNEYYISKMVFERNYEYIMEGNSMELEFEIEASSKLFDDSKAELFLSTKIYEKEFKDNKAPFFMDVAIVGNFSCEGNVDIEGFQLNGMAILLPYLRSIITSFTSQAGIPPVILPPINVYKAFEKEN